MSDAIETQDYYSDDSATFGDRVAAGREAIGMDQKELARRLGVKLKTIEAWEHDTAEPRANKLQMLAGVLNVSMRWLLTGEGAELESPDGPAVIDADVAGLLAELRGLRTEAAGLGERIGRLEKRLRAQLRNG